MIYVEIFRDCQLRWSISNNLTASGNTFERSEKRSTRVSILFTSKQIHVEARAELYKSASFCPPGCQSLFGYDTLYRPAFLTSAAPRIHQISLPSYHTPPGMIRGYHLFTDFSSLKSIHISFGKMAHKISIVGSASLDSDCLLTEIGAKQVVRSLKTLFDTEEVLKANMFILLVNRCAKAGIAVKTPIELTRQCYKHGLGWLIIAKEVSPVFPAV